MVVRNIFTMASSWDLISGWGLSTTLVLPTPSYTRAFMVTVLWKRLYVLARMQVKGRGKHTVEPI